jgi:hypothetical protein
MTPHAASIAVQERLEEPRWLVDVEPGLVHRTVVDPDV